VGSWAKFKWQQASQNDLNLSQTCCVLEKRGTHEERDFLLNRQEIHKKVYQTVHQLIGEQGYASPLDVLVRIGKVSPKLVEEWRLGRVPYLERIVQGNLSQMNFILTTLRTVARDLELKESYTAYMSWGKRPRRRLRFSKSGDEHTEQRYSTHYVKRK
jgi:hypothetical protein